MCPAPQEIVDLVERFARNIDRYHRPDYNETQTRREFIDPFFVALGWDVDNRRGVAPQYREVIHEATVRDRGGAKAPDYCFRVGPERKFFVEAKKPAVDIGGDVHPAYQLRRYAWSAKLPLSILTDFEEFSVYDCRIPPKSTDKAATARILYIRYTDYPDRWDEIAAIFSRDAVWRGDYDRYAETTRGKRGTQEVDAAFLQEIERWREALARNIALRNPSLTVRELNFAVQKTIDRIIFLRICEDRDIEPYEQLKSVAQNGGVYANLLQLFRRADDRYNSGLFHFREERGRAEAPDTLTPNLTIDDKVLRDIINGLYYPASPYEFSVLSADILGNVYEQFLGSVIRLTPAHRAVVEQKPEVRKAGGVYYTPKYIVDYIVKNTVGKLCEGKTPAEIAKLRILDPACGSGSFLLGAYQYLLDYHRDWYVAHPTKHGRREIYQGKGGQWFLTTEEKKRILLNNIYGVDIDPQAVEVTKLSLLLKVLEGENADTLATQLALMPERALPDLASNIKCGNSLIGPDFYEGRQMPLLDDEEVQRINPFDWHAEFPEIMAAGGFDAVIGNPPYGALFGPKEADYYTAKYMTFGGVRDVYPLFIEMGLGKLITGGKLAFIVPSAWLGGPQYKNLREMLLSYHMETVVLLPFDVFADAYVDTTVFVISKQRAHSGAKVRTYVYGKRARLRSIDLSDSDYNLVVQDLWQSSADRKFVLDPGAIGLLDQLRKRCTLSFADVIVMRRGVLFDKRLLTEKQTSAKSYPYFEGDVYRYRLNMVANRWVEFGDQMKERPKEMYWFEGDRILLRRLVNRQQRLMAAIASATFITDKNLYSILPKATVPDIRSVLGILNSRLISYLYINQVTQATKDDFPQVTIRDILSLPFPTSAADAARHDRMVALVERMLDLHKRLAAAKTPTDKTLLQRQIEATDREIDRLVYELYGLTEEEIAIVEGTARD